MAPESLAVQSSVQVDLGRVVRRRRSRSSSSSNVDVAIELSNDSSVIKQASPLSRLCVGQGTSLQNGGESKKHCGVAQIGPFHQQIIQRRVTLLCYGSFRLLITFKSRHDRSAPQFHSGFWPHTMVVSKRTRALVLLTVQNASISLLTRHSRKGHHQDLYLPSVAVLSAEVGLSCTLAASSCTLLMRSITFFSQPCILGYAAF